jgi:hypothetical protein
MSARAASMLKTKDWFITVRDQIPEALKRTGFPLCCA